MKRARLFLKNAARYPGSFLVRLLCGAAALIVAGALALIIGYILITGIPNLKPSLFALEYNSENVSMLPALINTVWMTVLALAGFDNMKLNVDEKGEDAEYLLSYLPRIRQETFTVGASWRHYAGRHVQTVTLSHNYLNNRNLKYLRNDDSSEDNLTLRLRSVEQKTALRAENRSYLGRWTLREGVEVNWSGYTNRTLQRLYTDKSQLSDYNTRLGIVGWGLFAGAEYASADKRFTASAGLRADGCDYSGRMARLWNRPSPRASVSYALAPAWSVSGSAGLYYQLPAYTALVLDAQTGAVLM